MTPKFLTSVSSEDWRELVIGGGFIFDSLENLSSK